MWHNIDKNFLHAYPETFAVFSAITNSGFIHLVLLCILVKNDLSKNINQSFLDYSENQYALMGNHIKKLISAINQQRNCFLNCYFPFCNR